MQAAPTFDSVTLERVSKRFGHAYALREVDVTFRAGEVTYVRGANGSGKSTLLAICAGLTRPTVGHVRYGTTQLTARDVAGQIGLAAHQAMLYPNLSGRENLSFFAELYGIADARARTDELTDAFDATAWLDKQVRTYSRGQLQRASLMRALLHAPRLVLLDEPLTALDRASALAVGAYIQRIARAGHIVVVVTHHEEMPGVQCNARVELEAGRVAAQNCEQGAA